MQALVVFHDHSTHWLAPLLKKGFGHTFVAVREEDYWVILDGRNGLAAVDVVGPSGFDLAGFYRAEGYAVVETEQRQSIPSTPFMPYNCVGFVRAILAIDAPWVITPWQLYKHLVKAGKRRQ